MHECNAKPLILKREMLYGERVSIMTHLLSELMFYRVRTSEKAEYSTQQNLSSVNGV